MDRCESREQRRWGDESPKKEETTIKLEGLFVSTEYETIGKAGAVLQLEGSE